MMAEKLIFIPRLQATKLQKALETLRIVVLTGARQTGKTTLAKAIGEDEGRTFVTLDRPESLEAAERNPEALWHGLDRITIDEVQRSPRLLDYLKIEVDRNPKKGRFLLTGSANLLLMASISDSLAGRAGYITLPPLTLAERLARPEGSLLRLLLEAGDTAAVLKRKGDFPVAEGFVLVRAVFEGGFPEAIGLPDEDAMDLWRESYVATYIERDLRNLSQIADLPDFLRLLRLSLDRSGQLVNIDGLARDAGISSSTARRWLNLLEVSFQVQKLAPYCAGTAKRLVKSPKLYAGDSGLACHLCGIRTSRDLATSPRLGALCETFLYQHLTAYAELMPGSPRIFFWRTARGREVDFVLEAADRLLPIEVKTSRTLGARDYAGLQEFLGEYPRTAPFGVVFYDGEEWLRPAMNILAIPWSSFAAN